MYTESQFKKKKSQQKSMGFKNIFIDNKVYLLVMWFSNVTDITRVKVLSFISFMKETRNM